MLPELDGQQALLEIRKSEEQRKIAGLDGVKIIMTTALDDAKNVLSAFRDGSEAYLTKPIDRNELAKAIEGLKAKGES